MDTEGKVTCLFTGETTITASFAGNDDYAQGQASYTLTITPPMDKKYTATLSADKTEIGCNNAMLTVTTNPTIVSDPTYEWYLNDTKINYATAATYTTDVAGTYKVLVTANGYPKWTNTVTITKEEPESVEIKRLGRTQPPRSRPIPKA